MISEKTRQILPECIALRRLLHENAELSFEEYKTTEILTERLSAVPGLTLEKPCKTGVIATLQGAYPGPVIAIRADIDALPITEENGLPFRSKNPGAMHACGHDGHTAMLLAAAKILASEADKLHGTVKFIFQHAEELPPGGAEELVKAGVLNDVAEVYGLHLSSLYPTGHFGIRPGALTSATDRFDIVIQGKGGHSAYPEGCIDPIVIAGQVITSLQTLVSRQISATEPAVVSICMLSAGTAYNIIPGEVKITGSTRTFNPKTREALPKKMEAIVKGACDAYGASYEFTFSLGYASVINDEKLTEFGRKVAAETFGEDHLFAIGPLMPGEDFAAMSAIRPGFFVELGAGTAPDCNVPHHNARYLLDEDALAYGIEYFCQLVRNRLSV